MKRLLTLLGVLVVAHVALLFVRPRGASSAPTRDAIDVGIVFDVGGRGDKSFNDGAFLGAERAERQLGARVRFIEPGEGSDREAGLRLLAAEGMDIVIGVGFIFTDDLTQLAEEYPKMKFAGVDYAIHTDARGNPIPPPPNLAALKFREEQGSFLVGALAALVGGSKRVGFIGGMDIPLIHKFEAGYRAGAKYVCPSCRVLVGYAGVTGDAFKNPAKGKELALAQYDAGADIVFHAAGTTGLGVFEAARERGRYAIGVDADQWSEAPGRVLTSMTKVVDTAVFETVRRVRDGKWQGGLLQLGLKEGGVDYVFDEHNFALIGDKVHARVEELRQLIIAGKIHVPDGTEGR